MGNLGDALSGDVMTFSSSVAIGIFVVFCRIGACLMLAPGISSAQIPVMSRLFIALAITLSLAPLALTAVPVNSLSDEPIWILRSVANESMIGGMIGLSTRLAFLALETLVTGAATILGFSNPFGIEVEPDQLLPPFASLITLSVTALIFFTDLHWEILRGLADSYRVIPIGSGFNPQYALRHVADLMTGTFRMSLRIASPFFIYALIANIAISLLNRLTPQIAIYFIATPFVLAGALFLLYFTIVPVMEEFMRALAAILIAG